MVAPPSPPSPSLFPLADVPVDDEDPADVVDPEFDSIVEVVDVPEAAFEDEDAPASALDELDVAEDAGAVFAEGDAG